MQTRDPKPRRQETSQEWQHRRSGLSDTRNVSHAAGKDPAREYLGTVIEEDGEHGPEEQPNERNRYGVLDERGDHPDGHFKPIQDD